MDFNRSISQAMAKTMEHLRATGHPCCLLQATAPLQMTTFPVFSSGLKRILLPLRARGILTQAHLTKRVASTLMKGRRSDRVSSLTSQPGRTWVHMAMARSVGARPVTTHRDLPRVSCPINDNYCVMLQFIQDS